MIGKKRKLEEESHFDKKNNGLSYPNGKSMDYYGSK